MSVDVEHPPSVLDPTAPPSGVDPTAPIPFKPPRRRRRGRRPDRPPKPRVRKLRLLAILVGLGTLALVSTVFGMMMAVASDVPQLENWRQYKVELANSFLYDDHGQPLGLFAPPDGVVIDKFSEIAWTMRRAIVATEDRRFWTNPGVDIRGIARAFMSDIGGHSIQGASTIAEQFVKNALAEQNNRTIFEKLREAALAFHLAHKWPKQKILTEYLNSIYFGNGAYGVESAARIYFGKVHNFYSAALAGTDPSYAAQFTATTPTCGDGKGPSGSWQHKCASVLEPWEAALLAGMVANPSGFDPILHPQAARARRAVVLRDMYTQHYLTQTEYDHALAQPLPTARDIQMPTEPTAAPYFTSWLRPQILAALGRGVPPSVAEYRAYFGGLKIKTTIDLQLQQAADRVISADLPYQPGGPAVSLVAIDNKTGQVRAMVGGPVVSGHEDFQKYPFNLATQGYRQPGSSFKPFTLAVALESGFTGSSLMESAPVTFIVPHSGGKEKFPVRNFGNAYSGPISLAAATAVSDNSVYARLGIGLLKRYGGIPRIARLAHRMGIRSPLSTNYAMILGGLTHGVSPLDMAHAYETFATGGRKVWSPTLGARDQGPIGIEEIDCASSSCGGKRVIRTDTQYERILPASVAKAVHDILEGVTHWGTGTKAAISGVDVVGKTGTTSNYGDAWFVGWTPQITVAVWVGVPDKLVSMATDFGGQPVEGGTWPAILWHDFVSQALTILANEQPAKTSTTSLPNPTGATVSPTGAGTVVTPTTSTPTTGGTTPTTGGQTPGQTGTGTPTTGTGTGTGGGTGNGGGGGGGTGTSGTGTTGGAGIGTGGGSGSGGGGGTTGGGGGGTGSGGGGGGGTGSGGGGGTAGGGTSGKTGG